MRGMADVVPMEGSDDPWIGQTLASYTLLRKIGGGGMGVIYLAQHQSLDRQAAVKFLPSELASNPGYVDMFLREANAAAKMNHTNIVAVYDAGHVGEAIYYFIMEYVEGHDLRILLEEKGAFPVPEAVRLLRQAASALGYAHKKKIIHRDIKPENLLLTTEGMIKVADLGLAKWVGTESSMMTQSGEMFGSPLYMSPERLKNPEHVDARTDIYSLGGTFYQMITGQAPFQGSAAVVMSLHLLGPVPDPQEANSSIDPDISAIVKRMMAKDPADRFQTMEEVDAALEQYQSSRKSVSPISKSPTKSYRAGGGRRSIVMVSIFFAVFLAVLGGFMFFKRTSGEQAETSPVPSVAPKPAKPAVAPVAPAVPAASRQTGSDNLLFDFEANTQGWRVDWGDADAGPTLTEAQAHHGKKSIAYSHRYGPEREVIAGVVALPSPKDLTGTKGLGAWVFLPEGHDWELQMYVRSGDDMTTTWGKIQRSLKGGWHRALIDASAIKNPSQVREIGVQVKRFGFFGTATIYVDQVEVDAE